MIRLVSCPRCKYKVRPIALAGDSGLCPSCDLGDLQRAIARAEAAKASGISRATAASSPDDRARIDLAIRRHAATGQPFSANALRAELGGVPGPLIGARFNALAKAGVIRHHGYEKSTKANTHAHEIKTWVGARTA